MKAPSQRLSQRKKKTIRQEEATLQDIQFTNKHAPAMCEAPLPPVLWLLR